MGDSAREAQPGDDGVLRPCSHDLRFDVAVLKQGDRRDAHDAVFGGNRGGLIDVQLDDLDLAFVLDLDLLELGVDQPAGAAPLGPEIDDDRRVSRQYHLVEIGLADRLHVCHGRCLLSILCNRLCCVGPLNMNNGPAAPYIPPPSPAESSRLGPFLPVGPPARPRPRGVCPPPELHRYRLTFVTHSARSRQDQEACLTFLWVGARRVRRPRLSFPRRADNCTDATGEIVDSHAQQDARVERFEYPMLCLLYTSTLP